MATTIVHVSHLYDLYEVSLRDNVIIRVDKYIGDTQLPREVNFNDLSEVVQNAILDKITAPPKHE
jgi:hypothetical protein